MAGTGFSLSGVALPAGRDPLGLWDVPQEEVSFGVGPSAPPVPTWRIDLPAAPAEAEAAFARQAHNARLAARDLATVDLELNGLVAPGAVAFSTSDELAAHKSALLSAADELGTSVSYGLFRAEGEQVEDGRQWQAFVDQVRQVVAHYARIETALAGQDVGRTTVGWTGDLETRWEPNVSGEAMRTHLRSVHLALSSRIALIRIVSVVATGAAGLAIKAAVPGGQLLLLPAVWRFVRDALEELRQSWPQIQHLR
jgi:hypothetical protein